ncbi:MAG: ECF transporter S component [Thermanaeromonas sp.]|uniref:ECF transporter S component n=1 Tax=Thermanaeromonas sp. TaxID=2003697 RepID=UPI002439D93E|nr:ECF transporter S component [Thermanaeromonas sp.]MCG0277197.1 ECF transporter S component [Thermanaeromonas sp.]
MSYTSWSARRIAYIAMFVALSAVGAYLKVPSFIGTPALDSFPGFLGALLLGPRDGALIAFLGHLFTALTAGFPLTPPLHLFIAAGMAVITALFAFLASYSVPVGAVTAIFLNSVLLPALFIPLPGFGKGFLIAVLVPLLVASTLNIVVALFIFTSLRSVFPNSWVLLRRRKESRHEHKEIPGSHFDRS